MDCVNPIASGESGWLAQVQGALQNVQQDLSSISSGASDNPDNLVLDGSRVLNGTIQSLLSETREMRYRRDAHGWPGEISPVPATSKSWRK